MIQHIFKSTGHYIGFINNNSLFSRDGEYLGWVEGNFVWDCNGIFRGILSKDGRYILKNVYTISPISKPARPNPVHPVLPVPVANIAPITLPIGFVDAF